MGAIGRARPDSPHQASLNWRTCTATPIPSLRTEVDMLVGTLNFVPPMHRGVNSTCPSPVDNRPHRDGYVKREPIAKADPGTPAGSGTSPCRRNRSATSYRSRATCRPRWRGTAHSLAKAVRDPELVM